MVTNSIIFKNRKYAGYMPSFARIGSPTRIQNVGIFLVKALDATQKFKEVQKKMYIRSDLMLCFPPKFIWCNPLLEHAVIFAT